MRKVVVLGASQCGKSSLIRRLAENSFAPAEQPTVGLNVVILADNTQLWDASGQPRYGSLIATSLCGAQAIILCYNIVNRASFVEVEEHWLPKLHAECNASIYLVGTHLDCDVRGRQVTMQDVSTLIATYGIKHFSECSARDDIGIKHIREFIAAVVVAVAEVSCDAEDQHQSPRPLLKAASRTGYWCCFAGRPSLADGEEIEL